MSEEKIIFNTEINTGNSEASVKSLRQQMRDLRDAMGKEELGSEAFTKLATQAGHLQEKMEKVKESITAFNPEKKFQAFAGVLEGTARGMEAVVGASALFGSENKNMEQAILKTQGAMALANGLNGLLGMKDSLKIAASVIRDEVTKAFGSLRAAIISTGIGALVIALGALIANWKEVVDWMGKSFPAFKKVEEFFKNIKSVAMGSLEYIVAAFKNIGSALGSLFTGHFSEAVEKFKQFGKETAEAYNKGYDEQLKKSELERSIEERKRKLDLLEAQGKDIKAARLKLLKDELSLLEKGSEEYDKKLIEVEKLKTEIRKKAGEERLKQEKKITDEANKIADLKWKRDREREADEIQLQKDFEKARANQVEDDRKFAEFQMEQSKAAEELAKKEQETKLATYAAVGNGIQQLSNLAGEETESGKALAIASATIDTYAGATKAYAQGGTLGFITAASIIAAGLANVSKIISVKVPKSSGGSSMPSIPSMSAPTMPNVSNTTKLINGNDAILTRSLDVKNNRVFVVETDITDSQKKVAEIKNKATIK